MAARICVFAKGMPTISAPNTQRSNYDRQCLPLCYTLTYKGSLFCSSNNNSQTLIHGDDKGVEDGCPDGCVLALVVCERDRFRIHIAKSRETDFNKGAFRREHVAGHHGTVRELGIQAGVRDELKVPSNIESWMEKVICKYTSSNLSS